MKRGESPREVTVVGYVTPSKWDQDENVIGVSIATDQGDYAVEIDRVGEELFDFVDDVVEATGLVVAGKGGSHRIKVTGYRMVDEVEEAALGVEEEEMEH
ncbi:MAG: hypothetical protein JXL84_18090 [Deltaproteobacteria bacterium]|nr:hypothetical protein [Deltaproteobacteria bacterium]